MAAKYQDRNRTGESPKIRDIEYTAVENRVPPSPPSAGGANVFVLSVDEELVRTVQLAAGEQYPVFIVTEWSEVAAEIEGGRCGIALLDADLIGNRLAKRLVELERYSSRLVTLVAADRNDAQELIGYLSDRKVHRLLIKPPALGITRLLLESAVNRCAQLRDLASQPDPMVIDARPRSARAPAGARWPAWILATALVSLVVGVVVVAEVTRSMWEASPVVSESGAVMVLDAAEQVAAENVEAILIETVPATASTPDPFSDLFARARRAFAEGRLAEPAGDNALDYYLTMLAAEPAHAEALGELANVVDALFTQAEAALLTDSLDLAAAALSSVRQAEPSSARLAFLDTQLERARARAAEAQTAEQTAVTVALPVVTSPPAEAPPPAARAVESQLPSELDSLLSIAAARIQRGQLLQPPGDSAREYIERAASLRPDDQRVRDARAELASAVTAAARVALSSADLQAAVPLLDEARRLGADEESLTILEVEIVVVREQRLRQRHTALFTAALDRLRRGALIEPEQDSALHYFLALKAENSRYPDLSALSRELTEGLAAKVRASLDQRDWSAAESLLDSLMSVDANSPMGPELTRRLENLRLQERYLAVAVPASELRLLNFQPPSYPPDAVRAQIEGWVELEFIVGRDGQPRELAAVHAEPVGRFEEAAIVAVSQYRYAPFELDGNVYDRRVRLRVRFTLQ
jgi:protein TonB